MRARCASECVGRDIFPLQRGLWRGPQTTLRRRPVAGGSLTSSTHLKSGGNLWLSGLGDELAHRRSCLVCSVRSVLRRSLERKKKRSSPPVRAELAGLRLAENWGAFRLVTVSEEREPLSVSLLSRERGGAIRDVLRKAAAKHFL